MLTITPFEEELTNDVIELILGIQQREFGLPITAEDQPDLKEIPAFYQAGKGNFWVARVQGDVVGTISLLDIGDGLGALRKMFVHPGHRGADHGVAQSLLKTLFAWCHAQAFTDLYLGTTDRFLAAHRFYEKSGFSTINKNDLPKAFPVMAVDSRFYTYAVQAHQARRARSQGASRTA
ncbi:N-acetyltransferase [Desulfoluna limicola]|uniref:N-acetyltransferase n=1 Tax=Desulfoluna limicola TaxID=2810562 RepID=A0ABN6F8L6_9BACT|nr:GNAT family N-acetyltransferase [Desulfoluna limicola]BCS98669.1 N-acetyltransferase [Desulfoluna limicola]